MIPFNECGGVFNYVLEIVMKLNISLKLPIIITVLSLSSAIMTGWMAFTVSSTELSKAESNKLNTVLRSKSIAFLNYIEGFEQDLKVLSDNKNVIEALEQLP